VVQTAVVTRDLSKVVDRLGEGLAASHGKGSEDATDVDEPDYRKRLGGIKADEVARIVLAGDVRVHGPRHVNVILSVSGAIEEKAVVYSR
jgi:hypothetical protein